MTKSKKNFAIVVALVTILVALGSIFATFGIFAKPTKTVEAAETIEQGSYALLDSMLFFPARFGSCDENCTFDHDSVWKTYKDKIKSYTFTNKQSELNGHDITKADDKILAGTIYDSSNNQTGEIYCYFFKTGEFYDCYVYAPVETIYSSGCALAFCPIAMELEDEDGVAYSQNNVESIIFSQCFNTSKTTSMALMFAGLPKLKKLDLSGFDTSNVTTFYSMFIGCSNLQELNISSFDFSKTSTESALCMFGVNKEYAQNVLRTDIYAGETKQDSIDALATLIESNEQLNIGLISPNVLSNLAINTNISKIIVPTNVPDNLYLGLPGGDNGELLYYETTAQVGDTGTWKLVGGSNVTLTTKAPMGSMGILSSNIYVIIVFMALALTLFVTTHKKSKTH